MLKQIYQISISVIKSSISNANTSCGNVLNFAKIVSIKELFISLQVLVCVICWIVAPVIVEFVAPETAVLIVVASDAAATNTVSSASTSLRYTPFEVYRVPKS